MWAVCLCKGHTYVPSTTSSEEVVYVCSVILSYYTEGRDPLEGVPRPLSTRRREMTRKGSAWTVVQRNKCVHESLQGLERV